MEQWIELESDYLTDAPQGKQPTQAYLFTWICKRTRRGVTRRRKLEVVAVDYYEIDDLDERIAEFATKPGVVLIPSVRDPIEYARCRLA